MRMSIPQSIVTVVENAVLWWQDKRPHGWDEQRHLDNPGVNCANAKELDIAIAVAAFIKDRPVVFINTNIDGVTI